VTIGDRYNSNPILKIKYDSLTKMILIMRIILVLLLLRPTQVGVKTKSLQTCKIAQHKEYTCNGSKEIKLELESAANLH